MIKLYALKYKNGIAQFNDEPLMGEFTPEIKHKLLEIKKKISLINPEYKKCKLIILKEIRSYL